MYIIRNHESYSEIFYWNLLWCILGELHVPLDVCGAVVKRELDYWKIDESLIEPCCWTCYSSYIDNQRTLAEFNQSFQQEQEELDRIKSLTGREKKMMTIWMTLDHPSSSKLALVRCTVLRQHMKTLSAFLDFMRGIYRSPDGFPSQRASYAELWCSSPLAWTSCWTNGWFSGDVTTLMCHYRNEMKWGTICHIAISKKY